MQMVPIDDALYGACFFLVLESAVPSKNRHGMDSRPWGVFLTCAREQDDAEQGQPKLDSRASSEAEERFD